MRAAIRILSVINRVLSDIGVVLASALLVLMTSAVMLQVISREMRSPIGWTEEVALSSMVWVTFLVGPWAYRQHQFTRIDVLIESVPMGLRSIINVGIHIFEALVLVGAIYYSWRFFQGGSSMLPAITNLVQGIVAPFVGTEAARGWVVPNHFVYFVLPLGFSGLLLVSVEHILRAILTVVTGRDCRVGYEEDGGLHIAAGATGAALPGLDDTDGRER